jgi:hypothetical protein
LWVNPGFARIPYNEFPETSLAGAYCESFFKQVAQGHLASRTDWVLGIALGVFLNVVGIVKLIDWLKDEQTSFIFPNRCLIPTDRK